MKPPRLLIFDLDGTLIDSSRDLVECVNATLRHCGFPPLPAAHIAGFIGDGAAALVERSLRAASGDPMLQHREALPFFLDHYREHLLDHTLPYSGVPQALAALHALPNAPLMAVLTNKPQNPSRTLCNQLGLSPYLFANFGGNSFPTKKPDPAGIQAIWQQAAETLHHAIAPEEIVMIGDSDVDIRTARNAGVRAWGCTWGFATAKMLAEHPDALAQTPADWLLLSA